MPTITVIIPVRDMSEHLAKALEPLAAQLMPGDVIVVVDDGSTPPIASSTAPQVSILRTEGIGPYAARNLAAQQAETDILLFTDGRCRARTGLLAAHREAFTDEQVALAATNVAITKGRGVAERAAAIADFFNVTKYTGLPGRPDYFPTANLSVRRAAFEAVGGFAQARSGSDADLCWRIQSEYGGRMRVDSRTLMDWTPRRTVKTLYSQVFRYGRSSVQLEATHPAVQMPVEQRPAARASSLRREWHLAEHDLRVFATVVSLNQVYAAGRRRELRARRDKS